MIAYVRGAEEAGGNNIKQSLLKMRIFNERRYRGRHYYFSLNERLVSYCIIFVLFSFTSKDLLASGRTDIVGFD
jgi:hypothetical protein